MKKNIVSIFLFLAFISYLNPLRAQESPGYKTSVDITVDDVGTATCEFNTKYSAYNWDVFTRTIGPNTSILMNQLIKEFPKYHLTEFTYNQEANARTNQIKFKINGMMYINKNSKWQADLDQKNPDITKISGKEYLLIEEGNTMKIHLPDGTDDSKIEKDSFGKAVLTYSTNEAGMGGSILRYAGILLALAGGWLLFKAMSGNKKSGPRIVIDQTKPRDEVSGAASQKQIDD